MASGIVGAYAVFVVFAWRDVPEYVVSAGEVARIDRANRQARLRGAGDLCGSAAHERGRCYACSFRTISLISSGAPQTNVTSAGPPQSVSLPAMASGYSCSANRHVFRVFRGLCRAVGRECRRAHRLPKSSISREHRGRDRLSVDIELHLRNGERRCRCAQARSGSMPP